MSREEWCADKLSKLLNEELRISTLNEIKDHLQSIPTHEVKPLVNFLDLPLVFDCLNDTKTEQVDLACDVLTLCLENLNIGESANKYGVSLERALAHPYPSVKLMVLKEIERSVKNEDILVDLSKQTSLLANIITCVGSEDLAVASKTCNILFIFGCSDIGIKRLTSVDLIKVFNEVQATNGINQLRVFEIFINISKESNSSFQQLNASGLISPIIENLNNEDILLRLNIIELLSQFGMTDHGFIYLESKNVLNSLCDMLKSNDSLSLELTEPGILKFFGKMAHCKPKNIVERYPFVLKRMFEHIETTDFHLVGVSVDAIGYIAVTADGKCALDSLGIVEQGLSGISNRIGSFPTEVTVQVLKFIENLLKLEEENVQISSICRKWYLAFYTNLRAEGILKYAKNPFSELRMAGLNILLAISSQLWGQEIIKDTPGLIEFLLDRGAETHKECKELKFAIVKVLSSSSIFDQQVRNKLDTYVKEGPFYVQGVLDVAFEGND